MPTTYAVPDGRVAMAATTYSGNSSTQSINNTVNGVSFAPDWVWIKDRNTARSHRLFDTVRGATKALFSDATNAETTLATDLTAFNSNGFALGAGAGSNATSETYVAWQWNAGGSTVTNTSGSISSQVRANTTAGFSVVTYTGNGTGGATVGHGLGVAPRMVIVKPRIIVDNWNVYHASNGASPATQVLYLNLANATSTNSTIWNNTAPTSSVFSIGTNSGINTNGSTYVAYCFSEVAGYSKFGSYTGNGNSSDGPFVYLGFRPRFILIKSTATANSWHMTDTSRSTYNQAVETVWANETSVESTSSTQAIDILSNGFKIRNSTSEMNNSGTSLIFAAFAENPFKYANAR